MPRPNTYSFHHRIVFNLSSATFVNDPSIATIDFRESQDHAHISTGSDVHCNAAEAFIKADGAVRPGRCLGLVRQAPQQHLYSATIEASILGAPIRQLLAVRILVIRFLTGNATPRAAYHLHRHVEICGKPSTPLQESNIIGTKTPEPT